MNKAYKLLVAGVFLLAFLIRFQPFIHGDFFFFQDQSRDLLLVKQVVEQSKIILIGSRTGFGGLFHGPLWVFSLVPTYLLSAGNPYFTLVPAFLLNSMAIVAAGFLLGWKLYGKWVGVVFAFFLGISSPLIAAIYYMTDAHVMPLIFIIYLYFIIKYLRGSQKSLIISFFFAGLGFQYEPAFSALLIPFSVLAILIVRKLTPKTLILSFLALLISVSNFLFFDLRHKFLMTNAFFSLLRNQGGTMPGYESFQSIPFRIGDRFLGLFYSFLTPIYSKDVLSQILLICIFLLAIWLLFKKLKQKKLNKIDREFIFLFSFPILAYILYILYPYPLWDHYILPITVVPSLLLSISILKLGQKKIFLFLFALLFILQSFYLLNSLIYGYFKSPNKPIPSDSSYINQLTAAKWILKDSAGKPFNYLVYIPSTLTYSMDYLFSWKNLVGSRRITKCSKNGLTYLIYYPPLNGDKNARSFWKNNVIRIKQTPISRNNFNGGILVEKYNNPDGSMIDPNYCQNLIFR